MEWAALACFYVVWLYALRQSIVHARPDLSINLSFEVHWAQVLFYLAIGLIGFATLLTIALDSLWYLSIAIPGVLLELAVVTWIWLNIDWDERAMSYGSSRADYRAIPTTDRTVLAIERTDREQPYRILYWLMAVLGVVLGWIEWSPQWFLGLVQLAFLTSIVVSQTVHMRYVAIKRKALVVRYGLPPIHLHTMPMEGMTILEDSADSRQERLRVRDSQGVELNLKLSPRSELAQLIRSRTDTEGTP